MAVIAPKPGREAEMARRLLALADDVQDVRTNTDNGFAFVVPEYLYNRFLEDEAPTEAPVSEEQLRRRPGRPRKAQPVSEGD